MSQTLFLPFYVAILIVGCSANAHVICGDVNCGSLGITVCCIVCIVTRLD